MINFLAWRDGNCIRSIQLSNGSSEYLIGRGTAWNVYVETSFCTVYPNFDVEGISLPFTVSDELDGEHIVEEGNRAYSRIILL